MKNDGVLLLLCEGGIKRITAKCKNKGSKRYIFILTTLSHRANIYP